MKVQIICCYSTKGGSGKTATATALAQAAAQDGKRTLAIDLDPQANMTYSLSADPQQAGSLEFINGQAPNLQHSPQGMDIISANADLATLTPRAGSANRLKRVLWPLEAQYDFIFIDTPPALGEHSMNALAASTGLLIPLETDMHSLQGLIKTVEIAHRMQESNPRLRILGTVLTRYSPRSRINIYLSEQIRTKGQEAGAPLLGTIRQGIAYREASTLRRNLFEYAPKSNPALDYMALYRAIKGQAE